MSVFLKIFLAYKYQFQCTSPRNVPTSNHVIHLYNRQGTQLYSILPTTLQQKYVGLKLFTFSSLLQVLNFLPKTRCFVIRSHERKGKNQPPTAVFFSLRFPDGPSFLKSCPGVMVDLPVLTTSNHRRRKLPLPVITEIQILHSPHAPLSSCTR